MDDDVKRLLEGFADQAAEGLPDADVEADVARGRRALRRIKRLQDLHAARRGGDGNLVEDNSGAKQEA